MRVKMLGTPWGSNTVLEDGTTGVPMGAAVLPRKKFIQTHAREVQNLNV